MLLITLLSNVQRKTNSELQTKRQETKRNIMCVPPPYKSQEVFIRQKMHACNQSNQTVSQSLERQRVENPPLFSPLPLSFPEAEYPHVCLCTLL